MHNHDVQLTSPYHFVPLSKWVYMPDWAHLVSHDVPFEDGFSGQLKYTLTNHTPLCVGSDSDPYTNVLKFARNPLGELIIPGSSLKGMLRNVLEIASFGKYALTAEQRFSYRDISRSDTDYLKNVIQGKKPQAGWLKYNANKQCWQFFACASAKIHHQAIAEQLNISIKNDSTALAKYQQLPLTRALSAVISEPKGKQKNRWAEQLSWAEAQQSVRGHCIFTNKRIADLNRNKAEDYEFSYFFYNRQTEPREGIEQQVQNLFDNHRVLVTQNGEGNDLVAYLQEQGHADYGMPVFAIMAQGKIHSLGFAQMPRASYQHSTHDLVKSLQQAHQSEAHFDLAELMFGTLRDEGFGLRSRVMFSDAKITQLKEHGLYEAQPTVLAEPKPSFGAAYLEQPDSESYQTYNSDKSRLAGWKRYPVRQDYHHLAPPNDNAKVHSKFELLRENHRFEGTIVFHNLKQEELAALCWVLTFNNSPHLHHSLGHAKPLGVGAVSFDIDMASPILNSQRQSVPINLPQWCRDFNSHMQTRYQSNDQWLDSPQLQYLLAMADPQLEFENEFQFNKLEEFKTIKNKTRSLDPLSYQGQVLSRDVSKQVAGGSLAFGQGRLAYLIADGNQFHQQELNKKTDYQQQLAKAAQQLTAKADKEALLDAELSDFERLSGLYQWIVDNQDGLTNTDKKQKIKELREYNKEIKGMLEGNALEQAQKDQLLHILAQIHLSPKDTDKIIKNLQK